MTDDYQLRKELDNYKWLFDELVKELERQGVVNLSELLDKFYDQSEIDIPLTKLSNDLTTLNTSLDVLQDSLVEFNGALIDFDEDNTNLEDDLTKLKDNLLDFLNVLGLLDVDLTQLQSSLSTLDIQINGDANTDGFVDTLTEIQTNIGTLEGMLTDFGNQLSNVVAGDNALALSLSTLSGYLTTFKGDLSELQAQIISDYGQSIYDSLDEDLVKLIASITQANDDLDSHQDLLDGLNDTIGSDTDTLNDGTLFGVLNNTSSVASSASTKANSVESTINNTVTPTLNQVTQTDIPNVKSKMGYNNIPSGSTLQGQITTEKGRVDTINNTTIPAIGDRIDGVDDKIGNVDLINDGSLQDQLTATNGAVDTLTDTTIPDVKSKMGYSNIPSGSTLQGQVNTINNTTIPDVKTKMGYSSIPNNETLQGQISSASGAIDTINNTTIPDVKDAMGYNSIPSGSTLQGQITSANGNVTDVKNKMGYSSIPSGSTLQGQITTQGGKIGNVPSGQTLQGQITAHDGIIGETTDTGSDNTLFGLINKTIDDIGDVQDDIGDVTQLSGTVVANIATAQGNIDTIQNTTIPDVKDKMGCYSATPSSSSLQGQINSLNEGYSYIDRNMNLLFIPSTNFEYVYCSPYQPDNHDIELAKYDYNFPTDLINYAYANCNTNGYNPFERNGSSWIQISEIHTSKTIVGVGFGKELGIRSGASYSGNCTFETFYDVASKNYYYHYVDPTITTLGYYGEWRVITSYTDFYKYTDIYTAINHDFAKKSHEHTIYQVSNLENMLDDKADVSMLDDKADVTHTHSTWTSTTLNNYTTLYVNEALHLCHLHYARSFNQANADQFYTWHTGLIPTEYRPSVQVQGAINQVGTLIVNSNGDILGKFSVSWSSSRTVVGDVWWHF